MLNAGQIELETFSCISIIARNAPEPPLTDWIFFYSPTSVRFFYESFAPAGQKVGVVGEGTAKVLRELEIKVAFQSKESDTEMVVAEFVKGLNPGETVLSPHGNMSLRRLSKVLPSEQLIEFQQYETKFKVGFPSSKADYLLMTSPSNARAYFAQRTLLPGQTVVSIGPTTDAAIEMLGIKNKIASQIPSEEGFWKAIQKDLQN